MNQDMLRQKRELVEGKNIIGIDPAKERHQASIVGPDGVQIGSTFSFPVSNDGFKTTLWKNIGKYLPVCNPQQVFFAIETSCNLWQTLAFYLHTVMGYTVLLVSPLSTHHERPILNLDFSRTDPKDAFLVGSLAKRGAFTMYEHFPAHSNALHSLGIAYDKLRKDLAQHRARVRALVERVFPEFLSILGPNTDSAIYLLKRYLFPDEFLMMDIGLELPAIEKISRRKLGLDTLIRIRTLAQESFGIIKTDEERIADRLILNAWIAAIESIEAQIKPIHIELVRLARQLPAYEIVTSLSGVGDTLGSLFLAEVRDLDRYTHFKQLEKLCGANLRLSQSGRYVDTRHISHIGNKRLLWIVYTMAEETSKRVPEIRCKYLRRQLKRRKHRKNVVAAIPQLLQLIVALNKDKRTYETCSETVNTQNKLEERYTLMKEQSQRKTHVTSVL